MSWFNRGKRKPGWLALALHRDHVDLVHVGRRADGTPEVALCDSFRKEGSDAATLIRLRKELDLDRYRCTTLLPAEQYQLHEIEAPNVPAAELKSAVRWRVKDLINHPVETATVEVLDIPPDPDAPGRNSMLYAVTARNDAIEACAGPFAAARIRLDAIDIAELAQRNIAALFESDGQGVAMLAFYTDAGMLTFTRDGELYASRRIEIPLAQLTEADDVQRKEHFERIALEVQRSLDHFERQYHFIALSKLLIAPLPREIGLHAYLAANIDGVVEPADLSTVMELSAVPELKAAGTQSQYLPAIGAALRGEQAVAA